MLEYAVNALLACFRLRAAAVVSKRLHMRCCCTAGTQAVCPLTLSKAMELTIRLIQPLVGAHEPEVSLVQPAVCGW
jgi:hypothetical protein